MKIVCLKELVRRKIGYGIVQPGDSRDLSVPVIKVNNIISGLDSIEALDKTTQIISQKYSRTVLRGGELLVSVVGTIGKTAIVPCSFAGCNIARAVAMIDVQDPIIALWVKYYIDSPQGQAYIFENLNTTVQATLNIKDLESMPIPLFERSQLEQCVVFLRSFDEKIALNNRINHNLEEQAQALFKFWFVDYGPFNDGEFFDSECGRIPAGWSIVTLAEMTSKFGTGLNPRKNFVLGTGTNYYVTIKNMGDNRVYLDDRCDRINDDALMKISKRSKLTKGDLLFSGIGTIGRVATVDEPPINWNTSESVFNMHPRVGISTAFIRQLLLSESFQEYVRQNTQGGVQQGIRMASLKAFKMPIPSEKLLRHFDDLVIPIVSQINENNKQNDDLLRLRSTILPRLMTGEIR